MLKLIPSWCDLRQARPGLLLNWVLTAVLLALSLRAVQTSPLGELLDQKLVQVLEFHLRSAWDQGPTLDPRLKIYFMDDRPLRRLGPDELEQQQWSHFLEAVAKTKPRLIMIDKVFTTPQGRFDPKILGQQLQATGFPIASIVLLTHETLKFVEPMDPNQAAWARSRWMTQTLDPEWLPVTPKTIYGPHPDIQQSLSLFGHALYRGGGTVQLFHRPALDVLIPHWSLWAATKVDVQSRGIVINGHPISAASNEVLVNFLDQKAILKQSFSLDQAIQHAEKASGVAEGIPPDQIVLILPAMDTGSSNLVESPFGSIPGSYPMIAMVNSVMTGQWIYTLSASLGSLLVWTILGVLVGLLLEPRAFAIAFLIGTLGLAGAGLWLFTWAHVKVFWFWPDLGFVLLSLSCFSWKIIRRAHKSQALKAPLADLGSPP